jgi:hypothetical protein
MANEELIEELARVRECLAEVAESVTHLIPKGELSHAAEAVVEDNRRWRRSVALLILGGPVLFLFTIAVFWQAKQNEAIFKRDIRQGLTCVLGDVSSHRRDQRAIEQAMIRQYKLEVELGPETTVPQEDLTQMVRTCGPVLSRFLGYSMSNGHGDGHTAEGGRP